MLKAFLYLLPNNFIDLKKLQIVCTYDSRAEGSVPSKFENLLETMNSDLA